MWVWVNSRSWWWTGRPGMLWFMGSQRVRHDWATELNWTDGTKHLTSCLPFIFLTTEEKYAFMIWRCSVFLITPAVVGNSLLLKDTLYRAAVFLFYYGHCFLSLYRTAILQPLCIELLAGTASGFSVILLRFFVGFVLFCFGFFSWWVSSGNFFRWEKMSSFWKYWKCFYFFFFKWKL